MNITNPYSQTARRRFAFSLSKNQGIASGLVAIAYLFVLVDFTWRSASISFGCHSRELQRIILEERINKCVQKVDANTDGTRKNGQTNRRLMEADAANDFPLYPDCTAVDGFAEYMRYEPRKPCPNDWPLAQKLILEDSCLSLGLPRRNCLSRGPENYVELPRGREDFRWIIPDDRNVDWSHYDCKSFGCLNNRTAGDCRECFQLDTEARRWVVERQGKMDLKSVMKLKPAGSIRLALDVGGGSGSFAARLADYNVTVVTTGINSGAPFLETIAHRGLLALHLSHTARLPMFDHTLDMIHSMHSVQYLPVDKFRLMIMDWDRVLRPGGLLWVEFLYLEPSKMNGYESVFKSLSYKEHEWFMEDSSKSKNPMKRLSVVLEKSKDRT